MTCTRCAGEVPDGSQFCNHCGAPIQGRVYDSTPHAAGEAGRRPTRATPILIALVLGFGAILVYQVLRSPSDVRAPVGIGTQPTPTEPTLASSGSSSASRESPLGSALTPAEFTIGPAGLRYFKISIGEHTRGASIIGKFNATGGAYNDIEVFVIGPDASVNPREGLYAKALYKSRRVSSDELDVPLSTGEYYLVFSNSWSPSIKTISADVTIRSQPQ